MTNQSGSSSVNLRTLILPAEHGGWGFLLEPVVLGLLVAFSPAGIALSIAGLAGFLLHQPLKVALKNRIQRRPSARTPWAERFAALFGAIMLVAIVAALLLTEYAFWQPLLVAFPLVLIQIGSDVFNRSRYLIAELAGALALGIMVSIIVMADGWTLEDSLILWLIPALRVVTSIVYIRARLRLERGKDAPVRTASALQIGGLIGFVGLAIFTWLPWVTILAGSILTARALLGLSDRRRPTRAAVLGFRELGYGLLVVGLVATGYLFNL